MQKQVLIRMDKIYNLAISSQKRLQAGLARVDKIPLSFLDAEAADTPAFSFDVEAPS